MLRKFNASRENCIIPVRNRGQFYSKLTHFNRLIGKNSDIEISVRLLNIIFKNRLNICCSLVFGLKAESKTVTKVQHTVEHRIPFIDFHFSLIKCPVPVKKSYGILKMECSPIGGHYKFYVSINRFMMRNIVQERTSIGTDFYKIVLMTTHKQR